MERKGPDVSTRDSHSAWWRATFNAHRPAEAPRLLEEAPRTSLQPGRVSVVDRYSGHANARSRAQAPLASRAIGSEDFLCRVRVAASLRRSSPIEAVGHLFRRESRGWNAPVPA